jgi:hypothetical protein
MFVLQRVSSAKVLMFRVVMMMMMMMTITEMLKMKIQTSWMITYSRTFSIPVGEPMPPPHQDPYFMGQFIIFR